MYIRVRTFIVLTCLIMLGATVSLSHAGRSPEKGVTPGAGDVIQSAFYKNTADSSKAVLSVEGMSCGGCVSTIKSSLAKFKGINEIVVDVAAGKAEVYYDDTKIKDLQPIAAAITEAGYPAKVDKIVPRAKLKKDMDRMAARSGMNFASVGNQDISRNDLEVELEDATRMYTKRYGQEIFETEQGKKLLDNLNGQIASRLINERIQLQEIRKAGFELDQATMDKEFEAFLEEKGVDQKTFKASLEKEGYSFEKYKEKFEARLLVNRYLDEKVFSGITADIEKRKRYSDWFSNAKVLAKVVYYDKEIEALVKSRSSGCGGSGGCSSGGGGCSGKK